MIETNESFINQRLKKLTNIEKFPIISTLIRKEDSKVKGYFKTQMLDIFILSLGGFEKIKSL
ncbi:hypothetical protein LEP1GSC016_1614 [Leptospira borgpetersenii serovar Hardjo-bovis str. Sponselee]|uniref:Uncharacterized protein n=1 Tax=Leptospira borgpetersenii serovar Hardjo-bovis str. Sponselee TaxID=1303729 RepID=M6BPF4_LEPBO|nr:hypothetical protein LBK6_00030 [Leptospira borgpetersenii serovar Hardjo]AWV71509.1 hypothetical protein B9T54_17485 [Leptospira borgpetersenii serovar Hardjo-bovis]EMJ78238.1 hypothetical protein LEP1GSC016_1614 [Leptospira borgpetersenii serovar Hardjo-bovis str. Sponselee]TQE52021.1 hypothetical protein FFZ95_12015 [Leptospira borgpetersenii]AMX60074.1 hypothetical protein LBK9_00030 [Leptospira borgpetersenii serovar Hardjo]